VRAFHGAASAAAAHKAAGKLEGDGAADAVAGIWRIG